MASARINNSKERTVKTLFKDEEELDNIASYKLDYEANKAPNTSTNSRINQI